MEFIPPSNPNILLSKYPTLIQLFILSFPFFVFRNCCRLMYHPMYLYMHTTYPFISSVSYLYIHRTFVSQINNMLLKNGSINHHKGPLQHKKTSTVTCVNSPARPKDLDHRRYRRTFGQQFCEDVHVHVDHILYKYSPNHSQSI